VVVGSESPYGTPSGMPASGADGLGIVRRSAAAVKVEDMPRV